MIGVPERIQSPELQPQIPCLAMRVRDAAKAIGVSERTLWEWIYAGKVPHIRMGKIVLLPVDTLREWLRQQSIFKSVENDDRLPEVPGVDGGAEAGPRGEG